MSSIHIAGRENEKTESDRDVPSPEATAVTTAQNEAHLTKRILFKTDTRILPILSLLFLCSFLDRTNVGNARIIGLERDLGLSNLQYNQGLAVFYATYIASELPSNLILKSLTPTIWLPLLTILWGIITMCLGFVRSYASFIAVRALLGLAEGGLLPGIVLYMSGLYTRGEMAVRIGPVLEREERFQWSEVRRGIFNVQVWLSSTAYFAILSGLYSFGLFLPTIINDMHITSSANETQLWSVIPYAVATPITVLIALLSDRLNLRGGLMLATLPIAIAGYAVIANVASAPARFAMTCLMAIGMYASVPCVLVWNSNNSAGHYKRATTSGLQLAVANCGGFVATFVYPSHEGPLYHKGHTIILGLLVYAWFAILANVLWCAKINRDKKDGKYAEFEGCGDDRDPAFKMVL